MGNACPLERFVVGGASFNVGGLIPDPGWIVLHNAIFDFAFLKRSSDCATNAPAANYDHGAGADMIDAE
jgi:hypothetical protein